MRRQMVSTMYNNFKYWSRIATLGLHWITQIFSPTLIRRTMIYPMDSVNMWFLGAKVFI